jgi:hypothetical protein
MEWYYIAEDHQPPGGGVQTVIRGPFFATLAIALHFQAMVGGYNHLFVAKNGLWTEVPPLLTQRRTA